MSVASVIYYPVICTVTIRNVSRILDKYGQLPCWKPNLEPLENETGIISA
jgi:hypothetical protein